MKDFRTAGTIKKKSFRALAVSVLFAIFSALCQRTLEAGVTRYLTGNPSDVNASLAGPALLLGGGGDVDSGIQWMINEVRGCADCSAKIDVVVLRTSGAAGYNPTIFAMNGVDSVESIVVSNKSESNRLDLEAAVKNAEVIFFAGGDQCKHVRNFKGTKIETAVESVYSRGGGVGGSSAGYAILSDFVYDACTGSTKSAEALSDPYHKSISFTYDFFRWSNMQNTFADQHVVARDRMGRTLAFLARQIKEGKAASVLGIAVNEDTSLALGQNGITVVMGNGPAYFILADHQPEVCEPKKPLTFSNFKIWKKNTSESFDLKNRPTDGYYLRSVHDGKLDLSPY